MSVDASLLPNLRNIATRLRIESIRATTAAGSGHPTTCQSAADLAAVLFFAEMRFDPRNPQHPLADRLVLSKGHAAPLLYALWAEAGFMPREHLTEPPPLHLGPRRPSDAAPAVRRRGDRVAGARARRWRGFGAERPPDRV